MTVVATNGGRGPLLVRWGVDHGPDPTFDMKLDVTECVADKTGSLKRDFCCQWPRDN